MRLMSGGKGDIIDLEMNCATNIFLSRMNTTKKVLLKITFLHTIASNIGSSLFALTIHLMHGASRLLPCALSLLLCAFSLLPFTVNAQLPSSPTTMTEQQLEAMTENNADAEIEDDSFIQSMRHFLKHPLT
jgi:hypothetical protein